MTILTAAEIETLRKVDAAQQSDTFGLTKLEKLKLTTLRKLAKAGLLREPTGALGMGWGVTAAGRAAAGLEAFGD